MSPGSQRIPKRLVIGNSKGGVSKSTTTRNLAVAAAEDGLAVATVDLDTQRSLSDFFSRRPAEAYPIENYTATMFDVADIKDIVGYDIVIIDTPPLVTEGSDANEVRNSERLRNLYELLKLADMVLATTLQQHEDITSTEAWMRLLKALGVKSASLLSATTRRSVSFENAKRRLNKVGMVCPIDVPRYEDIPASTLQGLGVCEIRKCKGADDFRGVWQFVKNQLEISVVE